MKKSFLLLLFLGNLTSAHAQGTMQFTAHLTGNSDNTGDGTFSLTTNFFHYDVVVPYGFGQGRIRSPWPDTNAPVIFDLHLSASIPPLGPYPGETDFRGNFTLTEAQITELVSGQWFVTVTAFNTLSGQINVVPEPRATWLLYLWVATNFLFNKMFVRSFNAN